MVIHTMALPKSVCLDYRSELIPIVIATLGAFARRLATTTFVIIIVIISVMARRFGWFLGTMCMMTHSPESAQEQCIIKNRDQVSATNFIVVTDINSLAEQNANIVAAAFL